MAGIKSPGLTSAPAIAKYSVELLSNCGLDLHEKNNFIPNREVVRFSVLSDSEKAEVISKDPLFGRVVCRCEQITEGEIVQAIRRPLGARTLDGVKRRCRPGAGRCQGGFCGPKVLEILARETGLPEVSIEKDKSGSLVLIGSTKVVSQ